MVDEQQPDHANSYYERLTKAIQESAQDGEYVIKWFAVVEVLDKTGDKGVWSVVSEDSTVWDSLGLIEFAKQKLKIKIDMLTWAQTQMMEEDDEDEDGTGSD